MSHPNTSTNKEHGSNTFSSQVRSRQMQALHKKTGLYSSIPYRNCGLKNAMLSRVVENIKYVSKSICSVYCAFKLVSIVGYPSTVWPHGLSGQHSKGQTHLSGSTGGGRSSLCHLNFLLCRSLLSEEPG